MLDFTGPGQYTDTPMGRPIMSVRSASVSPTTANFVVAYSPAEPSAATPPIEETLTMWQGWPSAIMRGRKVTSAFTTPPMFTPMIQSQSSKVACSMSPRMPMPALFTSTCTGPNTRSASSAAAMNPLRSVTSSLIACTCCPGRERK